MPCGSLGRNVLICVVCVVIMVELVVICCCYDHVNYGSLLGSSMVKCGVWYVSVPCEGWKRWCP